MMCGGKEKLPYDYELPYLESTGTQYINTGYIPNTKTTYKTKIIDLSFDANVSYKAFFGTAKEFEYTKSQMMLGFNPTSSQIWFRPSFFSSYADIRLNLNQNYEIILQFGNMTVNGTDYILNSSEYTTDLNVCVFSAPISITRYGEALSKWKCAYFIIEDNGDIIRDFLPVVATFNGIQEACFYNKAYNGQSIYGDMFYRNVGSGMFPY